MKRFLSNELLIIDGSIGEGGGQILRTSLGLSLVTGKPFRLAGIRAGRKKPGLLRQHLTAVNAAAAISQAKLEGADLGSMELTFIPGEIKPGDYSFAVGSAGSVTLVLQAVLPALLRASESSVLTLEGGTHNPFAPPFDFLMKTFLPLLNRMGANVSAVLERPGFYPAGGGKFTVSIQPAAALRPINLLERGAVLQRRARSIIAGISRHVAERELQVVQEKMGWPPEVLEIEIVRNSCGPGNVLFAEIESEQITEVFAAFGERGLPAESVANEVVGEVRRYLAAEVPVGEYLADQLMIPMALAGGGSFNTLPLSRHATTNIEIIQRFLDVKFEATTHENRTVTVSVSR